ncbi:hypothetical protein MSG28_013279 [Choristoneura fumiferana]|uniref:Uncharacterized protein n=1 Tax=Choristoneura fumiferana TaxID=7141 RepID=A0ACC0KT94_CHOFU|nr:hypothetical protein MSG28_013279 [Choristoneura fumiferana]
MRSSVSYILSHAPGESVMSHPDYAQQAQHHACLLVLVKGVGGMLKNFNKLWERIQRINNIKVTDSSGQSRDIWVRYVRDYPVENNDWGDFQTHRRLLGLITLSKFNNQVELNEVCRVHESLKVKYSNTLYDSRAFMFGPNSNMKRPEQEPETYSIFEDDKSKAGSSDKASIPSEQADSLSSAESFPQSASSGASIPIPEENFTTPSNFKTHAMFYGENDPVPDLEHNVAELINSLFWVVESRRLERSREKLEKVSLLLAPFEKKDFVGLDMESRNNKKRCMGRVTKNLADLTLQAGLVTETIILYPHLRNPTPLQRNASLQESSPNKTKPLSLFQAQSEPFRKFKTTSSPIRSSKTSSPVNPPSELTPSSSDSIDTSSRQSETDNADSESLASSSDIEYQSQKSLGPDLPSIPRQSQSQVTNQYLLTVDDIDVRYRNAIIDYSKYQNAGIIETEACFKAARISVEQGNYLLASGFLQNVMFINLTLSEQEKIQRFDTLAELYKEIGWPVLQIQLLHELKEAARRMGHPALATRHVTFLLQTMWPHLPVRRRPSPACPRDGRSDPPSQPNARAPMLVLRAAAAAAGARAASRIVFESIPETIVLAPDTPTTVNLHGTPKEVGELQILGYSTHTLGVKSNCRLKSMPMPNKFPASYTIEVIPSLPTITIETTVAPSGNLNSPSEDNVGSVTNISLYNGESTECTMQITNTSNVPIEYLDLAIQSNTDTQLQSKVFQWSNDEIQSQLPIVPNGTAVISMKLYGEADFLDLGGVGGENMFPNSLTSNYPSRVGSPVPNAQTSLPTQSSNPQTSLSSGLVPNRNLSGSFRSSNSHTTNWSAPISVMPPSRGRQIETQVIIRYSGGKGKEMHCRQSSLQINLELLPSVSITHWDVLPAEINGKQIDKYGDVDDSWS